ncbi:hypothetical protein JXA40_03600 [bacterium]|nr:hypothetical protein [candidate division CSSED10-310 bacterium]
MKLEYDLKKLYMDALTPQCGERVTFVNDMPGDPKQVTEGHRHRAAMTKAWHRVMKELAKDLHVQVQPVLTLDLRNPAPGLFDADGFEDGKPVNVKKVLDAWGEKDIVIAITGPSITGELIRRMENQNFRFASAPGVRADFEGFKADYSKIPHRFEALTQRMGRAVSADMTFRLERETWKCTFDLRGQRYQFNENGCARRPGEFMNLPSGCANMLPYPGLDGDPRGKSRTEGEIPAIIDDELIVFGIKENRIISIVGDGPAAEKEREHILKPGDPSEAIVTKLGLGVNDESRCNGTHVGDEKTMGMHWGYGPKKHFPDTIWSEHPVDMDMDFRYPDGGSEPIFRNSMYTSNLGELF